ncbi:MAG: DUF72 domain-containing protein [bacterium]|nr:DUF72 domain-containing protein [bacterium]
MTGRILFGTAGWSYEDWRGRVYPAKAGSRFDALAYISRYFDLVEVNSTFYRLPRPETADSWLRRTETNGDFRFLLKAPQAWTHGGGPESGGEVRIFRDLAGILAAGGRLGAILLQFPWSFRYKRQNLDRIDTLTDILADLPVAVEVRHGSFRHPDWLPYLAARACLPVNVDQPVIGNSLDLAESIGRTGAYFRMHGRNHDTWFDDSAGRDNRYDYLYDATELESIAGKIRIAGQALPTPDLPVFVVTNNHYLGQAAANALQLKFALTGCKLPVPSSLLPHYPDLKNIALPAESGEQGQLF